MNDIFDNPILCKQCGDRMKKEMVSRGDFGIRAMICPNCKYKILHPLDLEHYNKFINLKEEEFRVKMRIVGNSYTVSIPRKILDFMEEGNEIKCRDVVWSFKTIRKLVLNFNEN